MPYAPAPDVAPQAPPPDETAKPSRLRTPATVGMWVGLAGMLAFLVATTLPWYAVSGKFPDYGYPDWTLLIQFDGVRGLYVAPELTAQIGFRLPSLFIPISLIFALLTIRKFVKFVRAESHAKRVKLLVWGVIHIIIAVALTVALVTLIASFVPDSAPVQAKNLAYALSSHPFGGEQNFTVQDPVLGVDHNGSVRWGFGPALQMMGFAAGLLVLAAVLESVAGRKSRQPRD